ncbi:hypothetical protein ME763_36890 (plasmid) [Streptomyces murinus]|uniref:terpene synthase family protein n=1 Tax=Streptomyces murinus TaxID=33900 RepID=UPI0011814D97|nr:hypothetical protein [Streptomyces murinus]WDO11315.1 hypothetical protein ME763_36890 [Streptomyces murinus]
MAPSQQRAISIPPFYCPLEPAVHDHVDEIDPPVVDWLVSTGVREYGSWLQKVNATRFACLCFPFTTNPRAEAISRLLYLLGAWDDDLEDDPHRREPAALAQEVSGLIRAFELPGSAHSSPRPYERAMASLRRGLAPHMTTTQYAWFLEELRRFFFAVLAKNITDAREELLDLGQYLTLRMADVAGLWMSALVPIAGGYELPTAWAHEPHVRALCETSSTLLALDNDVLSYDREALQGNFLQHIYPVLMARDALTLPEAVRATRRIRDRIMTVHLQIRQQVLSSAPSAEVARFAATVGYIVRGNITWSATTHRFTHPQHPGTKQEIDLGDHALTWADKPYDASTAPLDIPAVIPWWDLT